ncbi:MAG TPA: RNase adapter RapZ [Actinomycetota bacterium]
MTPTRRRPGGAKKTDAGPLFTIVTGLSGAGRSEAAHSLEDLGYFVVDNLPPALIGKLVELADSAGEPSRVAIVADARGGAFFPDLQRALEDLRAKQVAYRILYLDASNETLVKRFEASRRPHPLAPADRMVEGIRKERALMERLREEADLIIDTSNLSPHELRDRVRETFAAGRPEGGLQVGLVSFGYKHGIPRDADLVFDIRFLPNPHWVEELRPLPGTSKEVRAYVRGRSEYEGFVKRLKRLLDFVVPGYVKEGKSYLTIAIGCTGGRHRSVVLADDLAAYFREAGHPVTVEHRDLARGEVAPPPNH